MVVTNNYMTEMEYEPTLEVEPSDETIKARKERKGKMHKPKKEDIEIQDIEDIGDVDTTIKYTYERCYTTIETIGKQIYIGPVDTSDTFSESVDDMERLLKINVRET
jgi:hypothetical protein